MGAIASLEPSQIAVAPGAEASVEVRIRNNGSVVDLMTVAVVGEAAAWSSVEPASISLFPGAEESVRITFRPPRDSSVLAGQRAFGARVVSQEDPAGSIVEEGRLEVGAFSDVGAELQPHTSRGSGGARHDLAIDNRGNVPLDATISGLDADQHLRFQIEPPSVVVDPGQATFAQVDVKARKRFWRGQPQTRPFVLQVEGAGLPPVPVSGTLLQESVLPSWFLKAAAAVAVAIVALAALWFLVLQPSVLSAAEERVADVLEEVGIEVPADLGGGGAGGGGDDGGGGGGDDGGGGGGGDETTPPIVVAEDPAAGRIRANVDTVTASDGKSLYVTDLIFSNPGAEQGAVRLVRNGATLVALRLENFRDLDFHFVTPIQFRPGDRMELRCPDCTGAALFYSGFER